MDSTKIVKSTIFQVRNAPYVKFVLHPFRYTSSMYYDEVVPYPGSLLSRSYYPFFSGEGRVDIGGGGRDRWGNRKGGGWSFRSC